MHLLRRFGHGILTTSYYFPSPLPADRAARPAPDFVSHNPDYACSLHVRPRPGQRLCPFLEEITGLRSDLARKNKQQPREIATNKNVLGPSDFKRASTQRYKQYTTPARTPPGIMSAKKCCFV